ncbi:MAG TPA: SCO family protein [Lentimicrobium sp.]|nr:SCO family protein [Lentimicrobium sp.]
MKKFLLVLIVFSFALVVNAQKVKAIEEISTPEPEIGIVEHLNEYIPDGIMVMNTDGQLQDLKQLIVKPTVLNLVYFRCPGICSPLMTSIAETIQETDLVLNKDYQILTISFDPREGTELAVKKRANYLNLIKKEVDPEGWKFFTADSVNISKLTNTIGFKYKKTGNDYMHPGLLTMLSTDGKITRYLQGTYFLPFEFKMAIIEASKGISGPTINKVLQFCYSYDPAGQEYVLNVTKLAGSVILVIAIILFLILAFKPKRKITA